MTHAASLHDSASIHALTGRPLDGPDRELFAPLPQFYPSYGSAVAALRPPTRGPVPFAALPFPFRQRSGGPVPGRRASSARAYDPLRIECDPAARRYRAETAAPGRGPGARRARRPPGLLAALEPRRPRPARASSASGPTAARLGGAPQGPRPVAGAVDGPRALRLRGRGGRRRRRAAAAATGPRWATAATCAARTCCWPAGWSRPACRSSTSTTSSSRARTGTPTSSAPTSTRRTCSRRPTAASRP